MERVNSLIRNDLTAIENGVVPAGTKSYNVLLCNRIGGIGGGNAAEARVVKIISVNNLKVRFCEATERQTLYFVHASGGRRENWRPWMKIDDIYMFIIQ